MEAAVAYYQATGKKKFLDIMCRYADHIDKTFGDEKGKKRGYPGHQEIELALVKLYRTTGEKRYLKLAEFFLTERGRPSPHYYNQEEKARGEEARAVESYINLQAHLPIREQKDAVGHAVRACYMYAGMADVVAETGNKELMQACRRLWKSMTQKRMYITGGIGSERFQEGFTSDYDLPNDTGYAETCAAIALVFFAHRMLHLEKDGQYADVMERALYNGVISGVSLDGKKFFYANRLAVKPEVIERGYHVHPAARQEWFGCSCCPPNVARLLASFGTYVYSHDNDGIWINLYVAGSGKFEMDGHNIEITQETAYPWGEKVGIKISTETPSHFAVNLRIPQWCRNPEIKVNGKIDDISKLLKKGYAQIRRQWKKDDMIELTLPMPVEVIEAHPDVRQDAGKVALQRGPIVYCLEQTDNGPGLDRIFLPVASLMERDGSIPRQDNFEILHKPKLLGGITIIRTVAFVKNTDDWKEKLYRPVKSNYTKKQITAIPYCAWANREVGEMLVWINSFSTVDNQFCM